MSSLRRAEPFLILISSLGSFIILFLFIPIASLFAMLNPQILAEVFTSPMYVDEVRGAFITTFLASGLATAVLLLCGIPLAYILARYSFPGKTVIESVLDIPLMIPHAVAGIMVLTAFGKRGLLGILTTNLGLAVDDSFWGIVAVMAFVSAPIMIDTVKAGFSSVDPMLEAVARSLGASRARVFVTVTLPLAYRSILAGTILSWARALSEVGAIIVVAYYPKTINVLILEYLNVYGLGYAIALAIPLTLLALALFIALRAVTRR